MGDDSSAPDGVPEALCTPLKGHAGTSPTDKSLTVQRHTVYSTPDLVVATLTCVCMCVLWYRL